MSQDNTKTFLFAISFQLSWKHFEFKTRLLLARFGFTVRFFFWNLFLIQDFYSSILNSKQGISWHSLVSKQDFSWKFWFHIKDFKTKILNLKQSFCWKSLFSQQAFCRLFHINTFIQTFWIRNKTFVGGVWFRSKTFLHNFNLNARLSFKHFEFETRILLVEFGFATIIFLRNLVSHQHFHSNIFNSEQNFCWWSLVSQQDFSS